MSLEAKPPSSTTSVAPPASNPPPPGSGGGGTGQECAGCGKRIRDRFLLKALDLLWHEDCLKCGCCDCRLGELGSSLYTKADLILCRRDYLRLFGHTGLCAACAKPIPAFEMVMRARSNVYHLECFACQQCNHRFCVGDRFYLCENKILCEYDYEERLVFANLAYSGSSPGTLAQQLKAAARHHHHPSQVPQPPPPPPPPPLNGQPSNPQVNGNGTPTSNGQNTPSMNGGPPQTSPASAPSNNPGQTTLGVGSCGSGSTLAPSPGDLNNNMRMG